MATNSNRVAFIDCEDDPAWDGHVRFWKEAFQHEYEWDVFRADASLPSDPTVYRFVLISGSHYAAYDSLPWLPRLFQFIRSLHDLDIKTLAGCFGSQAVAQALGGNVTKNTADGGRFVLRYEPLTLLDAMVKHPCAQGVKIQTGDVLKVLESHGDCVAIAPPGAVPLMSSPGSPHETWQCGSVLAFQSHPELTVPVVKELILHPLVAEGFLDQQASSDACESFEADDRNSGAQTMLRLLEAFARS